MFTQICALRGGEYSASYGGEVRVKEKGRGKETVAFPSFELRGTDKLYFAPPFLPPNACCYCLASPLTHPTPFFSPFSRLELLICPLLSLSPRNAIHTYYSAEKREGKIFFFLLKERRLQLQKRTFSLLSVCLFFVGSDRVQKGRLLFACANRPPS